MARFRIRMLVLCVAAWAGLSIPALARADVVTDWNQITFSVGGPPGPGVPAIQRTLAMVHIAMFDAVNSIERRYTPYAVQLDVPPGASAEAAAAQAAYRTLLLLFPARQAVLDAARDASLAPIPDGPAKTDGRQLGDLVAARIYALRRADNMLVNPPYIYGAGAGVYQLTPPLPPAPPYPQPVNTGAPAWVPFAMTHAAQFRPNGPLPVTHPKYVTELEEVRLVGATNGPRTAEQSLSALWHVEQSQVALNRIARTAAQAEGLGLLPNARLFALLNIAMADGLISVFEAKYAYHYWRPITAIHAADDDGNPHTVGDPSWVPFLVTPRHPEYPSAHGVIQNAGIQVLNAVFGQHYSFTTTSSAPGVSGITRAFESFDAFGADGEEARIYGGMHFRTAVEEGSRQGKKLGKWVLEHCLLPLQ